jgi:hypothetical protein
MKEIILPNVGKLAVVRGDLGQDRLRRYWKQGGETEGYRNGYLGVL